MTRSPSARFPILGLILILLGAGLLMERFGYLHMGWGLLISGGLMILGLGLVIRALQHEGGGKIFGGTLLFLYGALFLLSELGLVSNHGAVFLPATLLILGISFVMIFVVDTREWGVLIPGGIFLFLGSAFMLANVDLLQAEAVMNVVRVYWPVLLILIGVSLVFRRRARRIEIHSAAPVEPPSQPPGNNSL